MVLFPVQTQELGASVEIWDLAEEIDGEQVHLYLMTKKVMDVTAIDQAWSKAIKRGKLAFSDWDLETEYTALVQAFDIDPEQAEIYLAQKIYCYKLASGSFADPDVAKACALFLEAFG